MLDEEHEDHERESDDNDENLCFLGSIAGHNVAIVCLPAGRIGNSPAAVVAMQMKATFKGIRFGLIVGIGGGVPSAAADIRLGDVVVSQPDKTFCGVVQYDAGKATASGFERTGSLNSPPQVLLSAVAKVRANEFLGESRVLKHMGMLERIPRFQRSKAGPDVLFDAGYDHEGGQTCDGCKIDHHEAREPRDEEVVSHYGTIASGNQVIEERGRAGQGQRGARRGALLRDGGGGSDKQLSLPRRLRHLRLRRLAQEQEVAAVRGRDGGGVCEGGADDDPTGQHSEDSDSRGGDLERTELV